MCAFATAVLHKASQVSLHFVITSANISQILGTMFNTATLTIVSPYIDSTARFLIKLVSGYCFFVWVHHHIQCSFDVQATNIVEKVALRSRGDSQHTK